MSKLSDLIRRTARRESGSIGFHPASRPTRNPSLLVAATVRSAGPSAVTDASGAGADIVLIAADAGSERLAAAGLAADGTAVGLWQNETNAGTSESARAAGIDFLVFAAESTPAHVLLDDKMAFVLSLEEGLSDTELRAIESLPIEALMVGYWEGALTVRRQLELRRLSGLSRKPLILSVQPEVTGPELEALRDSGVVALILDGPAVDPAAIRTMKERIAALPPRRRRREERAEVSIPAPAAASHDHDEDDDD